MNNLTVMNRPAQISYKSWSHLQKAAVETTKEFLWVVGIRIAWRGEGLSK
jgi:hypothetical protein